MITNNEINPFDLLSGKVAKTEKGTFWFKEPGNNLQFDDWPIFANLHREGGPALILKNGSTGWFIDGLQVPAGTTITYYNETLANMNKFV